MKVVAVVPEVAKVVTDHGSCGFSVVPMLRSEQAVLACVRWTPGASSVDMK